MALKHENLPYHICKNITDMQTVSGISLCLSRQCHNVSWSVLTRRLMFNIAPAEEHLKQLTDLRPYLKEDWVVKHQEGLLSES